MLRLLVCGRLFSSISFFFRVDDDGVDTYAESPRRFFLLTLWFVRPARRD
jgi:hypothetical protein